MESLEATIGEVRKWTKNLIAKIIIQERKSHWETDWSDAGKLSGYDRQTAEKEVEIIDQPEISEPDVKKREEANKRLREIFETSKWYSARYLAGKVSYGIVIPFESWLSELEKELWATFPSRQERRELSNRQYGDRDSGGYAAWGEGQETDEGLSPDQNTRIKAIHDTVRLFEIIGADNNRSLPIKMLLKKTYSHNTAEVEALAGKALGYSGLKMFFHNWLRGHNKKPELEEGHGGSGWQYCDENGQWHKGHK